MVSLTYLDSLHQSLCAAVGYRPLDAFIYYPSPPSLSSTQLSRLLCTPTTNPKSIAPYIRRLELPSVGRPDYVDTPNPLNYVDPWKYIDVPTPRLSHPTSYGTRSALYDHVPPHPRFVDVLDVSFAVGGDV